MPDNNFDPDAVALMERALDEACVRAAAIVAARQETKTFLAARVIEGARRGIVDQEELTLFALRVIPMFGQRAATNSNPPDPLE